MNKEENPFDGLYIPQPHQDFHLLPIYSWQWTKTESLNEEDSVPFYDHSPDGKLFSATADCPSCGGWDSITIAAGYDGDGNCDARDWCCLACGVCGYIEGKYGELAPTPNDDHDEHFSLPEYVVIKLYGVG